MLNLTLMYVVMEFSEAQIAQLKPTKLKVNPEYQKPYRAFLIVYLQDRSHIEGRSRTRNKARNR